MSNHQQSKNEVKAVFHELTIGFIGGGVMGEALVGGLLRKGIVTPDQLIAADREVERGEVLRKEFGIRATTANLEVAHAADVLILAIKPQVLDKVLAELYGQVERARLVLTIIAGAPIARIADGLANPHVVRAMPNTPARIGQGITVWTAAEAVPEAQREQAATILRALGQEIYVDGEHYLDMATALSGTGPAYVFLFIEALIDAGVHLGFSRHIAEQLVLQTVRGSVEYAAASGEHPAPLRNQVTSPGGTTAEALAQLEQAGFRATISQAVWAAYRRSVALGSESSAREHTKRHKP